MGCNGQFTIVGPSRRHNCSSDMQGESFCVQTSSRAGRSHTPNVAGTDAYDLHFVVLPVRALVQVLSSPEVNLSFLCAVCRPDHLTLVTWKGWLGYWAFKQPEEAASRACVGSQRVPGSLHHTRHPLYRHVSSRRRLVAPSGDVLEKIEQRSCRLKRLLYTGEGTGTQAPLLRAAS